MFIMLAHALILLDLTMTGMNVWVVSSQARKRLTKDMPL